MSFYSLSWALGLSEIATVATVYFYAALSLFGLSDAVARLIEEFWGNFNLLSLGLECKNLRSPKLPDLP